MTRLEGYTPQSRGVRFNWLIGEMLRRHFIDATHGVVGAGEVDVAFSVESQRFIAEAKWEKEATSTDAIAKLQKRVRQRLRGTIGVFISMGGDTADAPADGNDGERL